MAVGRHLAICRLPHRGATASRSEPPTAVDTERPPGTRQHLGSSAHSGRHHHWRAEQRSDRVRCGCPLGIRDGRSGRTGSSLGNVESPERR